MSIDRIQSFEPGELNKPTQNICWYNYIRMSQISEPDQLLNHNIWISKTCTLIYHSLMFQHYISNGQKIIKSEYNHTISQIKLEL